MIEYFNEDCMAGMARYPDKYFDLAIIDPPYGIRESGDKNSSRSCIATSKNYKAFHGDDLMTYEEAMEAMEIRRLDR